MPKDVERCSDCGELHQVDSTEEAINIAEIHLTHAGHGVGEAHDVATKFMDSIVEMRELGLLEEGNREDGEPIVSEDLVGNFIKELDYDKSFELMWRLLRQEDIAPFYRVKMIKTMVKAMLTITGRMPKDRLEGFLTILSTLIPFNTILFSMKEGVQQL